MQLGPLGWFAAMLGNTYSGQVCSAARALEVIGERWTILIVRDAFLGVRRFDDFQRSLGIARNVLQGRLERLVENGILERVRYQERPERFEYRLTEKGLDLWPVVVSLLAWGDRHMAPDGPPVVLEHRGCGGRVNDRRICEACGALLGPRDASARRGPALADAAADAVQPALAARS
jgi:DNA-binding HxlR family transcriptional regulator